MAVLSNNNPKVSIVVPVYNVEKYLSRCLESIITQSLNDIEVILVNDGSTDRSWDIIKKFSEIDQRIIPINKMNGGYGSAINKGLEKSKGNYIGIVESDDWIKKDMYKKLYEKALSTDADIVKANFYNAFSESIYKKEDSFESLKPDSEIFSAIAYPKILEFKPTVWSAIYKTEFLKKKNIKMVETPGASFQDFPFAIETFCFAEKITLLNEPLYFYFRSNDDSSIRNIKIPFIIFDHFEYIDTVLSYNKELRDKLFAMKYRVEFCHSMWNFERIEKKYRKDFFRRWAQRFKNLNNDIQMFIQKSKQDRRKLKYLQMNNYLGFFIFYQYHLIKNRIMRKEQ